MTETLESAYSRHADELIRYATSMVGPDDAADVVTDAMIRVFEQRASIASVDNLRAYLFRAVHHRVVDVERARSRREQREVAYHRKLRGDDGLPESSHDARIALQVLSPQQRTIVFLTYWSDHPPAEIAHTLGISEGSVRKQLARARARLREVLDV